MDSNILAHDRSLPSAKYTMLQGFCCPHGPGSGAMNASGETLDFESASGLVPTGFSTQKCLGRIVRFGALDRRVRVLG
jgi:hypothetical protein